MSICDSSEFHDAEILVVAIDRESARAQLKCRLEDGQIRSVRFEGLKAFRSEDLTLQNVVSRVLRSSRAQISRDGVEYWLSSWVKTGKNGKFMSIAFEPKDANRAAKSNAPAREEEDDSEDMPF